MNGKTKINKNSILKKYSLYFLMTFLIVFVPFFIKNFKLGISGLYSDSFSQHLLFMRDYVIQIKNWMFNGKDFSLYNFNIGYGADIIHSYGYYSLIAILLPINWIEFSFYLILTIKLYLGGLFFCFYVNRFGIKNIKCVVVSGVFYTLGLCTLFSSLRHPIFATSFMIMPLLFLGLEKAISGESKIILILSTFIAVCSQFYLSVYILFGVELYLMFRLWQGKSRFKTWILEMIKNNLYIILAVIMSSLVLITQAYALSFNGRTDGNEMIIYSFKYYAGLIATFLIPVNGSPYTVGTGNIIAMFLVVLFILYYKNYSWLKKLILVECSFLLVPIFGYVFSLFSYVNNRWSFIILIPLILAMTISMDNFVCYEKKNYCKVIRWLSYTCVLALLLGSLFLIVDFMIINIWWKILLCVAVVCVFVLLWTFVRKIKFEKITLNIKDFPKLFIKVQIPLIFVFNIGMCFFVDNGYKFNDYYENEFKKSLIKDEKFYRVSKNSYVTNLEYFVNDSIYGGYSSTASFNTMNNGNVIDMINYFEVLNGNGSVGYNGLNNRYVLETLFGVKYFISKDSDYNSIPYNFSYFDSYESIKYEEKDYDRRYGDFEKKDGEYVKEKTNIFINNNHLSLGYVYDSCVLKENIDKLNGIEKQNILLNNLILENNCFNEKKVIENDVIEKDFQITQMKGIELENNTINVKENDGYLILKINDLNNEELYVKFSNIIKKDRKESRLTYSSDKMKNIIITREIGTHLYVNNSEQLVNMGYYENEETTEIKIVFDKKGEYTYDDLEVYSYKMIDVVSKINKLQENQLENIVIDGDNISATLDSNKDGLLFLSIPYNEGFKVYVNGEEKEMYKANIGFMAVKVEKGESIIEIKYESKYLKEGSIVSLIGISAFLVYIPIEIICLKKKNNKKIESENITI